jgi:hypothetical protein
MTETRAGRRERAIAGTGATYAAGISDIWETWQRGGPEAVAQAACPGGNEAEILRLTAQAERWVQKARARQARGEGEAPRDTGFSAAVQLAVRTRAGSCCEACGIWLGWHEGRVGRRRAGDFPFCDTVHNACLFCDKCRLAVEQRDCRMNAAGFWLSSKEDPREVPLVFHHMDGCVVWLTQDGNYSVTPPEGKTA